MSVLVSVASTAEIEGARSASPFCTMAAATAGSVRKTYVAFSTVGFSPQ